MLLPPYKVITSYCASGTVKRPDLISEWVKVTLAGNTTIDAYYHRWYGWMCRGVSISQVDSDGCLHKFDRGYVPLTVEVVSWV